MLSELGLSRAEVLDPTQWVELRQVESIARETVRAVDDPTLVDRLGRGAFSREAMGLLRPLARAFGSTRRAYLQMCSGLSRFNKIGQIAVVEDSPGRIVMEYRIRNGGPEETEPLVCAVRKSQVAHLPVLFDLPRAKVEHPACLARGDGLCRYEVDYREPRARWWSWASALGVGGLAAWLHPDGPFDPWAAVAWAGLGWCAGRILELQRNVAERSEDVQDANDALRVSVQQNERRFEQLQHAKKAVDQQVASRTSELHSAVARLEGTVSQLRELRQFRTRFLENVSHDLRTPLQLIVAPASVLADSASSAKARQVARRTLLANADLLESMVEDLLRLASTDPLGSDASQAEVELGALVARVLDAFRAAADARRVTLATSGEPQARMCVDVGWVQSALHNMMSNAMRVVSDGGWIEVQIRWVDDGLVLEVSDNGPGLPADGADHLLRRGVQGSKSGGSAGIGLSVVAEAARLHGGSVVLGESVRGGARVGLVLRQASTRSPQASESAEPSTDHDRIGPVDGLAQPRMGNRQSTREQARVVLVEDHPELRSWLLVCLQDWFEVDAFPNGEEALKAIVARPPDAVVTDLAMPRMDGVQLCRALRARTETASLPVLLLTAYGSRERVLESFDAGVTDFVTKPVEPAILRARLGAHVALRRAVVESVERERLAAIGLLAAEVAHQVRNPINVIRHGIDILVGEQPVADHHEELVEAMLDGTRRVHQLSKDLLGLASGRTSTHRRFAVDSSVRQVVRLLRSIPRGEGVRVEMSLTPSCEVMGDPARLGHVWLNLLDNAFKAAGRDGWVAVRSVERGQGCCVEVANSGEALPEGSTERLFDPFVTCWAKQDGTGLGLAVVRRVVQEHGGTVGIRRDEAGHTVATVLLPCAGAADPPVPSRRE